MPESTPAPLSIPARIKMLLFAILRPAESRTSTIHEPSSTPLMPLVGCDVMARRRTCCVSVIAVLVAVTVVLSDAFSV